MGRPRSGHFTLLAALAVSGEFAANQFKADGSSVQVGVISGDQVTKLLAG